jgi:hypothetical protein
MIDLDKLDKLDKLDILDNKMIPKIRIETFKKRKKIKIS